MLTHFFTSAFKNILSRRTVVMLNIAGLSIALSVVILVYLYADTEFSYDRQWENSERIVRLNMQLRPDSLDPINTALTSYLVMPGLREFFGESIEFSARRVYRGGTVVVDGEEYEDAIGFYEKEFIDIFRFDVVAGSLQSTMAGPGKVALSTESASEYFGSENPLGRTISLDVPEVGVMDYVVSAVYRMPEGKSALHFPSISLLDVTTMPERAEILNTWEPNGWIVWNFLLLKPNTDIAALNRQMDAFMAQHMETATLADDFTLAFQKITDIHFMPNRNESGGDREQLSVFIIIAILVLFVGITNYLILTTVSFIDRRSEMGIRKVTGAGKGQLILQFLGESLLFTLCALVIAVMLAELAIPFFSSLTDQVLEIEYFAPGNLLFVVALLVLVGGVGGIPAYMLIGARPANTIRNKGNRFSKALIGGRNVLVGFQFSIAIILVIATLVLYSQLSFYQQRDHGFNSRHLVAIDNPALPPDERDRLKALFLSEVEKLPEVESTTLTGNQPNDSINNLAAIPLSRQGVGGSVVNAMSLPVGYNFFSVYEIPLLAGRTHRSELDQPGERFADRKILINRFGAAALGFSSPKEAVGQYVQAGNPVYGEIIGVVENSQFLSLRKKVNAEIYNLSNSARFRSMTVKFKKAAANRIMDELEIVWRNIMEDVPFEAGFVDQRLQQEFTREINAGKLLMTLSSLAIFISCMGLCGLVAFTVKQQVKDIGVRKVLGAGTSTIIMTLIWQFTKPVLLANLLAWPLVLWALINWLQHFPYQISYLLLLPLCMLGGLISLFGAWVTVVGTAAKAASQKPVLALRYE